MIQSINLNDLASIVIRSTGERTEFLCKELVLEQGISEENITVIRKTPFSLALQASFKTGITSNKPWTLCLDADVLLRSNSIQEMVCFAEQQGPSIFEVRGLVLDKFFGGPRQGGIHLYRTSLLHKAIEVIPLEQNNIRPEQNTLRVMKTLGFPWRWSRYVVGVHDFEQFYADIYRKCFVHAHKHKHYAEIFISYWPQQTKNDYDYKVALKGFVDGLDYEGDVHIDIEQDIYHERFFKHQITEKTNMKSQQMSLTDIEDLVNNWTEPAVYQRYFQFGMFTTKEKLNHIRDTLGPFKQLVFFIGWGLEKLGIGIKKLVDKNNNLHS